MGDVWQTINEKYWTPLRSRTQKHVIDPLDAHVFTPLQTRVLALRHSILPPPKNAYLLPPLPDAAWISISSFCATSEFLSLRRVSLKHRRLSKYAPSWAENNVLTIRFKSLKECRSPSAVYEHILFALNKIPAPVKQLRLVGSSKHYGSQVDESDPHLAPIDDAEDETDDHHHHHRLNSHATETKHTGDRAKSLWEKLEEVGDFLGALHSPSAKSKEVFAMHTHIWLAITQLAEKMIEERKKIFIRFQELGEDNFMVPILPMLPAHVRGQSIPSSGSLSSFSSSNSLKSLQFDGSRPPSVPNSLTNTPTLRSFNSSNYSATNSACPSPKPLPPASNLSRNSSTGSYVGSPTPPSRSRSGVRPIDPAEYLYILFQHLTSFEIQWVDVDPVGISQILEAWCTSHGSLSKVALRHVQMKPSMEQFLAPEIQAVKPGFIKKAYGSSLRALYIESLPKSDIEIDADTLSRINTHLVQLCAYFGYECETLSLRVTNLEGKHLSFISSMFFPYLAHLHLYITPEPARLASRARDNNTPSSTSAWSILALDFPEPIAYHSSVPQIPIIDFLYLATLPLRTLHVYGRPVTWEMLDALAGNPQHPVIVEAASNRLRTHLQVANNKPQSTSSSPNAGSFRPTMDWRRLTASLRNNLHALHIHNSSAFQGRELASLSNFRQLDHLSLFHAIHLAPLDLMHELDPHCLQELAGLDTQGLDKRMWDNRVITRLFQYFRDHFPKMILQHNFEGIAVVAWNNRD